MLEQINKYIGKTFSIAVGRGNGDIHINVIATGAKPGYGKELLIDVKPVAGTGHIWVKETTLRPAVTN